MIHPAFFCIIKECTKCRHTQREFNCQSQTNSQPPVKLVAYGLLIGMSIVLDFFSKRSFYVLSVHFKNRLFSQRNDFFQNDRFKKKTKETK